MNSLLSLETDFLRTEEEVIAQQERELMEEEIIKAAREASLKEAEQNGYQGLQYDFGVDYLPFDLSKFVLAPPAQTAATKQMSKKEIKMCLIMKGFLIPDIDRAMLEIKSPRPTLEEVEKRIEGYKKR